MDLTALNKQALFEQKPSKRLRDLPKDQPFPILSMRVIKGKYGKCVIAELEENIVFLPNRMVPHITGKESQFLPKKYSLIFKDVKQIGSHETSQFEIVENK